MPSNPGIHLYLPTPGGEPGAPPGAVDAANIPSQPKPPEPVQLPEVHIKADPDASFAEGMAQGASELAQQGAEVLTALIHLGIGNPQEALDFVKRQIDPLVDQAGNPVAAGVFATQVANPYFHLSYNLLAAARDLLAAIQARRHGDWFEEGRLLVHVLAAVVMFRKLLGEPVEGFEGIIGDTRGTLGRQLTPKPQVQARARILAQEAQARGDPVIANLGGAGAKHEPQGAININNMAVGRKGIPNLVVADGSHVGELFNPGTVDRIEGHNMAAGVIDWNQAAPGSFKALKSGGTFDYRYQFSNADAEVCRKALEAAGFTNVRVTADAWVRAVKP